MKPSKEVLDRSRRYDVKIVLPRIKLVKSKSQPKTWFKRKKSRVERSSDCSDKENDNSGSVVHSQPNLSLIQIEKLLNLDQRDEHLKLSAVDRKLVGNIFNKRETETTEYSRIGSCRIEDLQNSNENVRYSKSKRTRSNTNNWNVDISSPKHQEKKKQKDKCYRKDSGIDMELPKAERTKKRNFSNHLDYQSDDVQETSSIIHSSKNEICDLEDIIQSHSSHTCSDKVDHKINNIEIIRTSMGLYVHRDFEIRITQVCTDQPSKNTISACTTSVIASTTRSENIQNSLRKEHRNVAVEKKIGINTRVKVGDREKNCTRIVESKLVEITEQRHKRIKLEEPSGMVTRRKAAVNLEYKFCSLINKEYCSFIENPNIFNTQSDQLKQNQDNGADQRKKLKPPKIVLPKERKPGTTNEENNKNESKSLCSKPYHSLCEERNRNADKFENITMNLEKKTGFNKTLKDVTLYRLENTEPRTSQVIQKIENSIEKKTLRRRKRRSKKILNLNQTRSKPVQEAEVIAGTKQLRNSTKSKKRLNDEENAINSKENSYSSKRKLITRTNAEQSNNQSAVKIISRLSLPKARKRDFRPCAKLKGYESTLQMKNDEVELPKKSSNLQNNKSTAEVISPRPGCSGVSLPKVKNLDLIPFAKLKDLESTQKVKNGQVELPKKRSKLVAKKLMKKKEALKKTERFNEKKKILINGDMTELSKTVLVPLKDISLPRRVIRSPSKTRNSSSVANTSKLETSRGTPGVTFSSKTPKTIPRTENENRNDWDPSFTPCILLDKLDAKDISSYAITPLREDRHPLPSKSTEDYGIDDVNTDDSTDEEDNPKKTIPNWVESAGFNSRVQFYFPRDVILTWIRPPKKRFTVHKLFT